jgi:hypothetical protein
LAVCKYHPDRQAIGVCMRCRAVICAACCTRLRGINHCHACLRKLGRQAASPTGGVAQAVCILLILGLAGLVWTGVFWLIEGRLTPTP